MPANLQHLRLDPAFPRSLRPTEAVLRATLWPTRSLDTGERLFDEFYIWTQGYQPSTMQRARLQILALREAFALLEFERVDRICVTLSFGTVERALDLTTEVFDANRLLAHRLSVMLRGQVERLRSPYRLLGFIDWLRAQNVAVGYRLRATRMALERKAIELVQPRFALLTAPPSNRLEYWRGSLLEARAAGLYTRWLIAANLDTDAQRRLARQAGFSYGQGCVVGPAYDPPGMGQPQRQDAPRTA
jgi:hypothetical protein